MSRYDEIEVTRYLADRLTAINGVKFEATAEHEEANPHDTYIENMGYVVPVQNVSSEGDLLKTARINTRAFKSGKEFIASDVDHKKWVSDVLEKKKSKNYPEPINIVLVIRGSMPTAPPDEIQLIDVSDSPFGGIYYVSMPNTNPDSGYIVALKKYWTTPDIF